MLVHFRYLLLIDAFYKVGLSTWLCTELTLSYYFSRLRMMRNGESVASRWLLPAVVVPLFFDPKSPLTLLVAVACDLRGYLAVQRMNHQSVHQLKHNQDIAS